MDDLLLEYEGSKPTTPSERQRRRRLAATVTICGLAFVGIGQLSTGALFTDNGTADVQFASGSVAISLDGPAGTTGQPKTLVLPNDYGNMAPGDVNYIPIQVDNSGSLKLRYAVTATSAAVGTAADLTPVLTYTVNTVGAATDCNAAGFGTATVSTGTDMSLSASETALIGDKANGAQAGDQALTATSSQWLCVKQTLPLATGNAYQSGKADVTLKFYAEQTANNP